MLCRIQCTIEGTSRDRRIFIGPWLGGHISPHISPHMVRWSRPIITRELHTNHSLCLNDHPLVMYLSTVVRLYAYDASFDFGARLSVTRSLVKRGLNFEDDRGKHGKHARRWQDCGAGLNSHVLKVLLCAWWRSWIVVRLRLCHGSRRRP